MGSGPFMFKRDEWVPGNKVVFVRNPHYVGRSDPPNGAAGSKTPHFDRVEWLYIPDANSAVAALKKGEVDLIEQVPPDYINPLRADPNIRHRSRSGSWQGWIVMNQLHPPFNNIKVRQAVLKAVNQDKFMSAMGYPKDLRVTRAPPSSSAAARTRPSPAPSRGARPTSPRPSSSSPSPATRARRSCCWCRATSPTSTPRR